MRTEAFRERGNWRGAAIPHPISHGLLRVSLARSLGAKSVATSLCTRPRGLPWEIWSIRCIPHIKNVDVSMWVLPIVGEK